jgi:sugar lactone lactonase YvrE
MKKMFSFTVLVLMLLALVPMVASAQDGVECAEQVSVQKDDWLSKYADKYFGNVLYWPTIMAWNNQAAQAEPDKYDLIENPDLIVVGWSICIPSAEDAEAFLDEGVLLVSAFNAADGGLPEGLTIDKSGNTYVTVGYPFWFEVEESFGEVWKIGPDGEITVLDARPGGPSGAGLAMSPAGVLYYAWPNPGDPATNGVYRLADDGQPERLPGSENIMLANGLAFDEEGDLFVSDSALGTVWRIPNDGGEAENWLQHEWLAGCADIPGANGVALWQDSLYVANTGLGLLARVPILEEGTAGEPEIVAGDSDCDPENDALFSMDGIALDEQGNVFALLVMQHKLVRIDPTDGSHTVLLTDEDGLYNPASIAFGTGTGDREYVFMSNFALLPPEPANSLGPGVLKYEVGVPGLPLP